jgi:hypothetical protein
MWVNWKVPVTVVMVAGIQDCSAIIHKKEKREAVRSPEQVCKKATKKNSLHH